jgi:glucoamylase
VPPRWTSSVKDAVGTAYSASSRIWFTVSHGILNEIYHPTIDHPQTRDLGLLVSDGASFCARREARYDSRFEYIHPEALGVRYTNRDKEGRYNWSRRSSATRTTASS